MRTIVIATHEEQRTLPPEPKSSQRSKLLDCVKAALLAIAQANSDQNQINRQLAIEEYDVNLERALDAGVRPSSVREKCEATYLRAMVHCLQGVAYATVDGEEDLRDQMADWYEDDRQRMIEAGFAAFSVDARANTRVWKGIR